MSQENRSPPIYPPFIFGVVPPLPFIDLNGNFRCFYLYISDLCHENLIISFQWQTDTHDALVPNSSFVPRYNTQFGYRHKFNRYKRHRRPYGHINYYVNDSVSKKLVFCCICCLYFISNNSKNFHFVSRRRKIRMKRKETKTVMALHQIKRK